MSHTCCRRSPRVVAAGLRLIAASPPRRRRILRSPRKHRRNYTCGQAAPTAGQPVPISGHGVAMRTCGQLEQEDDLRWPRLIRTFRSSRSWTFGIQPGAECRQSAPRKNQWISARRHREERFLRSSSLPLILHPASRSRGRHHVQSATHDGVPTVLRQHGQKSQDQNGKIKEPSSTKVGDRREPGPQQGTACGRSSSSAAERASAPTIPSPKGSELWSLGWFKRVVGRDDAFKESEKTSTAA